MNEPVSTPEPTIQTFGLSKRFPAQQGWRALFSRQPAAAYAVDHVDLAIRRGELFGLLGPNGAGKTTLIKMLATLIQPTAGDALINGYPLAWEQAVKASIGLATSDERSFYWRLSGRENLRFFAGLLGLPAEEANRRVETVLEQVDLFEKAGEPFRNYSTGMRQRLTIARALLHRPGLLFLDEPSKGLDPGATRRLHRLIREDLVDRQGITVFLTTHNLEEARLLCDRVAVMNHGRILACGTVDELRSALQAGERYQMRLTGLNGEQAGQLVEAAAWLEPQPGEDGSEWGGLAFEARNGDGRLDAALDLVRSRGISIQAIEHQPVSLETVFEQLTESVSLPPEPGPTVQPAVQTEAAEITGPPDATHPLSPPPDVQLRSPLQIALAFLRRDFLNEASYRFAFFLQFFGVLFSVTLFYFIAQLLGETAAPFLKPYGGDYFSFVLIGIAFSGYFGVGLSSFASSLRQAQITGTLEAMLATPTGLSTIILSSSLWDYLLTTLRVVAYLLVGAGLMGMDLSGSNLPAALLVLALTVLVFSSLGILAASFVMVLKRGDPVTWVFNGLSTLLGGVYYPVSILPGWLQAISSLLPVTYALEAMRLALLQGASFAELWPDILALLLFGVTLLPASLLVFRFAVRRAKEDGSLTHY